MQWAMMGALIMGIVLMLSITNVNYMFAQKSGEQVGDSYFERKTKSTASLAFNLSGCNNEMTCAANYLVGEAVDMSGTLTSSNGRPITNAEITILQLLPKPELVPIASGITGIDGAYSLSWEAVFTPIERALSDINQKYQVETIVLYAQYDGDEAYQKQMSSKLTATVNANKISTTINAEKRVYAPGQGALLFLGFIDKNDEFVDPDSITVMYDGEELLAEKKKTGSYTVMTPNLTMDHHQVIVMPQKDGYNLENGFLTIQVSGFFGKV